MSSLLPLALLATFASVALAGYAWNLAYGERRKSVRILEAQVADTTLNLRDRAMSRSFGARVLLPVMSRLERIARRITPLDARRRLTKKLVLAGSPARWDVEKTATFKVLGIAAGALLGVLLFRSMGVDGARMALGAAILAMMGFFFPDTVLNRIGRRRQEEIRRALPDTMDLLTISVEAGLGFDAALAQVLTHVPGALTQEIGRTLHEMRLGVSRVDAFRHLGDRTDVEELRSFVLAMVQADSFGISISGVLRAQARELRTKRRQRAEEKAMKMPVKILFPLIFCVLPALFVVVLGPGAIRIATTLFNLNL